MKLLGYMNFAQATVLGQDHDIRDGVETFQLI